MQLKLKKKNLIYFFIITAIILGVSIPISIWLIEIFRIERYQRLDEKHGSLYWQNAYNMGIIDINANLVNIEPGCNKPGMSFYEVIVCEQCLATYLDKTIDDLYDRKGDSYIFFGECWFSETTTDLYSFLFEKDGKWYMSFPCMQILPEEINCIFDAIESYQSA